MDGSECDSCLKTSVERDKYRLRCGGDCRRKFCMACTGLDKSTTKLIYHQKYPNIRFFCTRCDSPTLKYLHEKVTSLRESQIPLENVEALGSCLKENNNILPVINEIYDTLSNHYSKWSLLLKKVDDMHSLYTSSQEPLIRSINEIKQDVFNLVSLCTDDGGGPVRVQVHDSSREDLIRELAVLRRSVNDLTVKLEKCESARTIGANIRGSIKTASTQTDLGVNESSTVATAPKEIVPALPEDSPRKDNWHYMVVSGIPPTYTSSQLAHYIKTKLGTTDFIRCFPMLRSDAGAHSDFKIGVKNITHMEHLRDVTMWPSGTSLDGANSSRARSEETASTNTPSNEYIRPLIDTPVKPVSPLRAADLPRNRKSVSVGSDGEAIAASRSLSLLDTEVIVEKKMRREGSLPVDPMTPPVVRMSRDSDLKNGRYVLSRLREPSILQALRLFLSYLHNQPPSVCFDGYTNTSIKLMLASEGLPGDEDSLRELYFRYHASYGVGSAEVEKDLSAFRSYYSSENPLHLQKLRESHSKYYSSGSSSRSQNF